MWSARSIRERLGLLLFTLCTVVFSGVLIHIVKHRASPDSGVVVVERVVTECGVMNGFGKHIVVGNSSKDNDLIQGAYVIGSSDGKWQWQSWSKGPNADILKTVFLPSISWRNEVLIDKNRGRGRRFVFHDCAHVLQSALGVGSNNPIHPLRVLLRRNGESGPYFHCSYSTYLHCGTSSSVDYYSTDVKEPTSIRKLNRIGRQGVIRTNGKSGQADPSSLLLVKIADGGLKGSLSRAVRVYSSILHLLRLTLQLAERVPSSIIDSLRRSRENPPRALYLVGRVPNIPGSANDLVHLARGAPVIPYSHPNLSDCCERNNKGKDKFKLTVGTLLPDAVYPFLEFILLLATLILVTVWFIPFTYLIGHWADNPFRWEWVLILCATPFWPSACSI